MLSAPAAEGKGSGTLLASAPGAALVMFVCASSSVPAPALCAAFRRALQSWD